MNHKLMDAFTALADPTRRSIVEMLASGSRSAGEIGAAFPVSPPAISQHLKVLREAGLVAVTVAGQRRIYALDPAGIEVFDAWVQRVRAFWPQRLDALERALSAPETGQGRDDHGDER